MQFERDAIELEPAYRLGGAVAFGALAVILLALGFEHVAGYQACPICLQQRYAYYAGIPAAFAALVLLSADKSRWAGFLLYAVALAFLANAGLGVYHAGIEWGFWPGPDSCAGAIAPPGSVETLTRQLETEAGVRCDEASWRFLGLSFAGWNVVASLALFAGALQAAFAAAERD